MGLDTTHNCWSGPYPAFNRFRTALAKAAGMPALGLMEGHWEPIPDSMFPPMLVEVMRRRLGGLPVAWASIRPDPALHVLLDHSECDGELAVDILLPLALRLEDLVEPLKLTGNEGERWSKSALNFAAGCRWAADEGDPVLFR